MAYEVYGGLWRRLGALIRITVTVAECNFVFYILLSYLDYWTWKRIPNGYERFSCWGSCCYQMFKVLKLFHFTTDRC